MSKFLQPTLYKGRPQELQWLNNIFQTHDMICGCKNPVQHLHHLLKKDNKQLCLPSTEETGETSNGDADAVDNLLEGDLDRLFEEDFEEDEG